MKIYQDITLLMKMQDNLIPYDLETIKVIYLEYNLNYKQGNPFTKTVTKPRDLWYILTTLKKNLLKKVKRDDLIKYILETNQDYLLPKSTIKAYKEKRRKELN